MTEKPSSSNAVVLHVSEKPEDVSRAVAAAKGLTDAHPDLHVRIIVNGPALVGVTTAAEQLTPDEATTVEACQVGMHRRDLAPDQLQPTVQTVGSAVVALAEAQLAGAAYIRL